MNSQEMIATMGAIGLGFVLGWTLFFANRGKSGNLSTSDLAAIAGVVAGGAVTSMMSKIDQDGELKSYVFGGYGIGLVLGFLVYFLLVWLARNMRTTGDLTLDDALRSTQAGIRALAAPSGNLIPVATLRRDAAMGEYAMDELTNCLKAVEALIDDLSEAADTATDPEKESVIRNHLRKLDEVSISLNTGLAIEFLNTSEVKTFLDTVQNETKKLNAEAEQMKKVARNMESVAKLLGAANDLVGALKMIVN